MTQTSTAAPGLGPVRRWVEGMVLFAENDLILMAYAVTDDPDLVGSLGWVPYSETSICVEYIGPEAAKLWDGAVDGEDAARCGKEG